MQVRNPYEVLGRNYAAHRRPDPRIAALIDSALGSARTVLNVGAGAGAYEPVDRQVTAAEPARVMIAQRRPDAAPVVRAFSERLPFADRSFDAGMAILTVHHWTNVVAGLAELRRVSRRQIILTWDKTVMARYWLVAEYLPEAADHEVSLPDCATIAEEFERTGAAVTTIVVPVPTDCTDGFLAAYWRSPDAYLDPEVRQAISGIAGLDQQSVQSAIARLAADLESGRWNDRHQDLLGRDSLDAGYRLLTVD